jgi:hypothetical protein
MNLSIGAGVVGWTGGIACFQPSTGYGVDASAATGLVAVGRWTQDFSNSGGASGAMAIDVEQGTFKYYSGTGVDLITQANVGGIAWIIDDQTLGLTNGGGARSPAGIIVQVDSDGGVWCEMSLSTAATLLALLGTAAASTAMYARAVVTALSGAYTGSTTGTLTASANAAFGTQDGVATLAVGDVVWLQEGLTNLTAASDAGPYVIQSLGSASSKWILSRPSWWASGAQIPQHPVDIGPEGTFWQGTQWKSFAVKGSNTVDANAPKAFVGCVTQSVMLVAGTVTISNVGILSASKTGIGATRTTANTCTATTGGYQCNGAPTAGAIGTGSVVVFATVAAGTINNADVSTLSVTITNW